MPSPVLRTSRQAGRIHFMDELRGLCVLLMIFYHGFYTMSMLFGFALGAELLRFFMPAEPFFAGLFILISGVSSQLSHSNLMRGLKLLGVALLLTLATYFIIPEELITFGILHMLSLCMILYGLGQKLWNKIPLVLGLLITALGYAATVSISAGYLGIPGFFAWEIPQSLYDFGWLFPLGLHSARFFSADYFPLFPWIFVFFAGTYLGRFAKAGKFPAFTYQSRVPFLSWMGRHALVLYVAHQPVIFGLCYLIAYLMP